MLLCAAFAVVPGSAGAVGWVTGSPLTPSGHVARDPGIVETAAGTRVLAWQQRATGADDPASINVRVAPPGAGFGATQAIPDDSAAPPSLRVGSDGTVALAWLDFPNNGPTIRIARLAPGASTFVVAAGIAAGGSVGSELQTAVAGGDILVAYSVFGTQGPTTVTAIDAVRLPAATTTIQRVPGAASPDIDRVSFTNTAPFLMVANPTVAAVSGTIFVAWEHDADGAPGAPSSTTELRAAQYTIGSPPGATFSAPVPEATVTTPGTRAESIIPQLTGGAGRVIAAWRAADAGPINDRDLTAGPAAPTNTIPTGAVDSFQASLAGDGTLVVAWQTFDSAHDTNAVLASAVPSGQAPSPPTRLTAVNASRILAGLVTADDGRALIITNRQDEDGSDANDEQVQAAVRPPRGAFGPLEEVSGAQDHSPAAAFDPVSGTFGPHDDVLIAWGAVQQGASGDDQIDVSARDATPPTVSAVTVPTATIAGTRASLSAHATDTQSPVSIEWRFGDGSSAAGMSVTHAYGAPGTYTVTAVAQDGAGNTATVTRAITVRPNRDLTPPRIGSLSLTNRRFRVGGATTAEIARARRTPVGTAFRLRVDERSTIVIVLRQRMVRHHRRVTTSPGTLVRSGRGPGAAAIEFSGRLGRVPLRPGAYTATVTAVDAAGNRSRGVGVRFEVVAR
ncbi:MAG: PKD domain-containing protein [Solirubrobacteraceae bacterium]